MTHEKQIARRYALELGGSMALYAVLVLVTSTLADGMPDTAARTAVLVSPMFGFVLALWAMVRQVKRMDEYMRMQMLETISLAAAITAGLSFTYGFLEAAGFPRLSMFAVWGMLGGASALIACYRRLRDK